MEWLKANDSAIPGPTIIYPRNMSPEVHVTFVILDKLPGELAVNVFGRLPYLAKVRDMSRRAYARIHVLNAVARHGSSLNTPTRCSPYSG